MSTESEKIIDKVIENQGYIFAQLKQINSKLDVRNSVSNEELPFYEFEISQYFNFDWNSIDCKVVARDKYGAIAISYRNLIYKRRNGKSNYGNVIMFSRGNKEDNSKEAVYTMLCRFIDITTVPNLPDEVLRMYT